MTTPDFLSAVPRLALRWLAVCGVALAATAAAAEALKSFDIAAGTAVKTLRQFSEQSGLEVVFGTATAAQVRTNPVKGDFAPREALRQLLDGTGLQVVANERTGALTVSRDPNVQRATPVVANARVPQNPPTPTPDGDERVQMTSFEVIERRAGLINEGVIPRIETAAFNYTVLSRADIERSGATDIATLFQREIPQNTSWGTGDQQAMGSVNDAQGAGLPGPAAESINLRGFGGAQTVILINGRRTYGGEGRPGDVNRIPLSAIERVEVLPGSAAAMYGGNATAGVVNVILRKDYVATEFTERFSISSRGDAKQNSFTTLWGWTGNQGRTHVSATLNHTWQERLKGNQREFYTRVLNKFPYGTTLTIAALGGNAFTRFVLPYYAQSPGTFWQPVANVPQPLGIPGNPTAVFAVIPAGWSGTTALTAEALTSTAGTANVGPAGRYGEGTLLSGYQKTAGNLQAEHKIRGDQLGLYVESGLSHQRQPQVTSRNFTTTRAYTATDPLNPIKNGRSTTLNWNPIDMPPNTQEGDTWTGRFVNGIRGVTDLRGRRWTWALDGSWEASDTQGDTVSYFGALGAVITAGLYNPLRDITQFPHTDPNIWVTGGHQHYRVRTATQVTAVNLRANGELWQLPAGWARLSVGSEVRWEDYYYRSRAYKTGLFATSAAGQLISTLPSVSDTSRRAAAGYFEATAPLLSERWTKAGIHALELSAAGRFEQYDDFTGQNNQMIALRLAPIRDVAVRFSFGNAFNPPTQSLLHQRRTVTDVLPGGNYGYDSLRGGSPVNQVTSLISGGNKDLKPETSHTSNLGLVFTPRFARNLTFSLDAFHIRKVDTPVSGNTSLFLAYPAVFADRLIREPLTTADRALGYTAGIITGLDLTPINLASVDSKGVDLTLRWNIPTERLGRFVVTSRGTYSHSFETQANPVVDPVEQVGLVGNFSGSQPLTYKGNLSVYWDKGPWGAGINTRYISSYASDTTVRTPANTLIWQGDVDGASINASLEADVEISYDFAAVAREARSWRKFLAGTRWKLRVNNVLDQEPPQITDRFGGYSRFNSPLMRYFILEVRKPL
jgi:outer membrane receptor protein involved in Fe transport